VTDDTPRVDSHQHFWDLSSGAYDWPTAADGPIFRSFAPPDLAPGLAAAGIDATVVVQTNDTLADTDAMIAAAAANPWIAGIVGWAPLTDLRAAAEAIESRLGRGLRGIRHLIHREDDPDWLMRDDVERGLSLIASYGLTFDVVAVFPNHLRHVAAIADRLPDLVLVIDHLAKPPIRGSGWDVWRRQMANAAERPNVVAKLSGLDTAAGPGWTTDELRPSVDVALEVFGPDRLLFGSDWPVCLQVSAYGDVVAGTERALEALTPTERAAVLGGTARRIYRLSPG
jgi:L-fuconolactonase